MLSEQFTHFFANNKCRKLAVFGVILYLKTAVTKFFFLLLCPFEGIILLFPNPMDYLFIYKCHIVMARLFLFHCHG